MKALIGVLVLAAAGVGGFFAYKQFAGGGVSPSVGAAVSAEHTVLVGGMGHLDELAAQMLDTLKGLPAEMQGPMAPALDPAQRTEKVGFDPATAAGWASIGVDPKAGFAFVIDGRLVVGREPVPVLLAKIDDRDKLLAAIEKWVGEKPTIASADGVETLTAEGETILFGKKGEWTAVLLTEDRRHADAKGAFAAFLADSGAPLSGAATWKDAFADGKGAVEAFGYIGVAPLAGFLGTLKAPAEVVGAVPYYAERFPAMGVSLTRDGGMTARITATEEGLAVLQQVLRPKKAPPTFSRYLPAKGWGGLRLSVNLAEIFEGVAALVPPTAPPQVKAQLGMVKAMMGAVVGIEWDDISSAFSGHVVLAANLGTLQQMQRNPVAAEWVVLVAAGDGSAGDTLVGSLVEKAGQMRAGPKFEKAEVAGAKGWKTAAGPMTVVAVRDDDVWLVGPEKVVTAALATKKGDNLKGKADVLDDDAVVYGIWAEVGGLLEVAKKQDPQIAAIVESGALKGLNDDPTFSGGWRLDGDGLLATSESALQGTAAMMGVMAAIAIPAFVKYIKRSKTIEASMNVRKMFDSAVTYYYEERAGLDGTIQPQAFPPSAPLTPAYDRCAKGEDKFLPTADHWNLPGWLALNFAMDDPHYYRYEFISSGTGRDAKFTARAIGDLDCDGVYSTFERVGSIDDEGNVTGGVGLYMENELE